MGFELWDGFEIRFYGITMAIAVLVAFLVISHAMKKENYKDDLPLYLLILCVPLGVIGGRIFFVIFSTDRVNLFDIRNGGLAIYGSILICILAVYIFSRIKKVGFFTIVDFIVPGLILAQAIGRWGNFFNIMGGHYEVFGLATGDFHFFPLTVLIGGKPHLSTWLYESILSFVGFFLLWRLLRAKKENGDRKHKFGTVTAVYFIFHGTVRAILEPLREDALTLFGDNSFFMNRISFLISIALVAVGLVILYLNKKGKISQDNRNIIKSNVVEKEEEGAHVYKG